MPQRGRATGRTPIRPEAAERGPGSQRARLRAAVAPVVSAAGYDLEDLTVSRAGRRQVLRVMVDSDSGVNLDTVAALSREISAALDAAERADGPLTAGEYTLEVTSPGVHRPLTQPRHWRRNAGRLVAVRAGDREVTARVVAADEQRVRLQVDGELLTVPYAQLGPGRVQLDFSRVAELGDEAGDDELEEDEE